MARKAYNEKLHGSKDLPKIEVVASDSVIGTRYVVKDYKKALYDLF